MVRSDRLSRSKFCAAVYCFRNYVPTASYVIAFIVNIISSSVCSSLSACHFKLDVICLAVTNNVHLWLSNVYSTVCKIAKAVFFNEKCPRLNHFSVNFFTLCTMHNLVRSHRIYENISTIHILVLTMLYISLSSCFALTTPCMLVAIATSIVLLTIGHFHELDLRAIQIIPWWPTVWSSMKRIFHISSYTTIVLAFDYPTRLLAKCCTAACNATRYSLKPWQLMTLYNNSPYFRGDVPRIQPRLHHPRLPYMLLLLATCWAPTLSQEPTTLTVGYLANVMGKPPRQGHIISGAMTYAVEIVNRHKVLPDNYTLEFLYRDTRGETLLGTEEVIALWRKENVIAFFGPENSCEVEATVAASLNLPMISYKCADSADKDITTKEYKHHFAKTYPPNTKVVSSVLELLRYYKWYKFSVVYEQSDLYETVTRSLERAAAAAPPFQIRHLESYPNTRLCCYSKTEPQTESNCCFNPFVKIVDDTERGTRIYVFLGDVTHLNQLMTVLALRGHLSNGNYMVIYVDFEMYVPESAHRYFRAHESGYETVMMSSRSLLVLVSTPPRGARYDEFDEKVRQYNGEHPFMFSASKIFDNMVAKITPYASYLYDAVTLYADALGKALRNGTDPRDGREIMRIFRQRGQYISVTGALMGLNQDGEIEGNYTVLSWQPTPKNLTLKLGKDKPVPPYCMLPAGRFYLLKENYTHQLMFKLDQEILWVNRDQPPLDEPPCGFDGSGCIDSPDKNKEYAAAVLGSLLFISFFAIYMVYKNWKYEQEIDGLLWRLDLQDIQACGQGGMCMTHSASKMSLASHGSFESRVLEQIFTHTAVFKGTVIAVKQLQFSKKMVDISRKTKKEMKLMREMHYDNINQFIGACVDPNCVHIVTEYCSKGSLQDILENDDMKLDNMFIASLVFDLIKALIFLHEGDLKFHGNLKSTNCVVSSRWVLQVTDFGLHELRSGSEQGSVAEHQYYRNLLWKAPELLRYPSINPFGSQKGDVYAFGIILHEIIVRQGPFGATDLTPKEIVLNVKQLPGPDREAFRPATDELQCQDYIVEAMRQAWHERPEQRPDFHNLKARLRKMRDGMKLNIMDHMMAMMEKYAYNLEELVDERTVQLLEEKKKTEALLHRMLPKSVANQLMRGEAVIPETFDAVTIYFSDIVGFTEMSASSTPMEVVQFLNDLYTVFDDIIGHYDVYKVETIGDAYMVVSGLPIRNGDSHAGQIAHMALELLESVRAFRIQHKPLQALKLRIGVHTGPVAAGVVGLTMPRYCLFGDTVNTASRMESNGEALKIHISPECKEYLDRIGGYLTEDRGLVKMKGKGEINTHWLVGHELGPVRRPCSTPAEAPAPPQPLFALHREEGLAARRRSPKLQELGRRGSLAARRNSSYADDVATAPCSPGGVPVFLRLSQESPRSPKRLTPYVGGSRLLHPAEADPHPRWYGSASASSCGELHNVGDNPPGVPGNNSVSATSSPRKPKLESIYSEDCEHCAPGHCSCRTHETPTSNRNGLIHLDESLRPLLSREPKIPADLQDDSKLLRPPAQPSKRWRSCDEIVLPKGVQKGSLKVFFTGLLGNKGHETDAKNSKDISLSRMQEHCEEESLV